MKAHEFRVMCSNLRGTYTAGRYVAESASEACDMARANYQHSPLGRSLRDVGAFRFYTVDQFPHERED